MCGSEIIIPLGFKSGCYMAGLILNLLVVMVGFVVFFWIMFSFGSMYFFKVFSLYVMFMFVGSCSGGGFSMLLLLVSSNNSFSCSGKFFSVRNWFYIGICCCCYVFYDFLGLFSVDLWLVL